MVENVKELHPELSVVRARSILGSRVQIARHHQLERQPVGPGSHTDPNAGFDIHGLAAVIHDCPDFMQLVVHCFEVAQWP